MSDQNTIFCGAHGCALKYCCLKEECKSGINKITKIFYETKDRDEELIIYNQLKLNSLEGNETMQYFIGDAVDCDIDFNNISEPNLEKIANRLNITIDDLKNKYEVFNGISYTDGGDSLIKYVSNLKNIRDYNTLLDYLKNVFKGVKILHHNGIYHLDLKPDNIVIGTVNNIKTCRLIDFGDSFQSKFTKEHENHTISREKQKKLLKSNRNNLSKRLNNKDRIGTLEYMSPEMYILSHKTLRQELGKKKINTIKIINRNTFIESQQSDIESEYLPIVEEYVSTIEPYIKNTLGITFLEKQTDYSKIIEEIKEDIKILTPETVRIKYIKSDIWSLGIILLFIYSQIEKNIKNINNEKEKKEQKELILINLKELIIKLLIINPEVRPDAKKSLELYEEFLSKIEIKKTLVDKPIKGGMYKSKKNSKSKKNNKTKYNKKYYKI
jgi:serine/threonine protein kinase